MELDTLQEQRNLIERLVKTNNKFSGNEDLLEDFCSETYKRSHSLFDSVNIKDIENYISKVANTSILTVLKQSGRVRRRKDSYVTTKEILVDPTPVKPVFEEGIKSASSSFVYEIEDPKESFEEKIVRRDLLQKVVDIVLIAQTNDPTKEFLKIFYLRYVKEMKQKQIAEEINLSQSEVSKRLVEISEIVKAHF